MTKKIIQFLFFIIIIAALATFTYFYYIKPQREFIKINTQSCINNTMSPINSEVAKYEPNPYTTERGFSIMLETQRNGLKKCTDNYNTILFSKPEKDLFLLNLNSAVASQKAKIDTYISKVNQRVAADKKQQEKQQACANMKAEQEKQSACMQERFPKPGMDREAEALAYSQMDEKAKICEEKYDYKRFGVDEYDCVMIDIFGF